LAQSLIREILSLSLFDGLQHETGDELRLVATGIIGRRTAAGELAILFLPKLVAVMNG